MTRLPQSPVPKRSQGHGFDCLRRKDGAPSHAIKAPKLWNPTLQVPSAQQMGLKIWAGVGGRSHRFSAGCPQALCLRN